MSMYLSVTIEGRERNKQTGVNVRITGENLYTLPLDYEQTEDLMTRLYNYLKAENISDPIRAKI